MKKEGNPETLKIVNSNSSDQLNIRPNIQMTGGNEAQFGELEHRKLSKEAQLILCIRNISPYLNYKIDQTELKQMKTRTHDEYTKRSEHNTSKLSNTIEKSEKLKMKPKVTFRSSQNQTEVGYFTYCKLLRFIFSD